MKTVTLLQAGLVLAWSLAPASVRSADGLQTASVSDRIGLSGGAGSYAPKFSADGRYVVFVSHANNLVTNDDRRAFLDVFRQDRISGDVLLVSVNASGAGGGDEDSNFPDLSADGRYVAFVSAASNLVNNDTNGEADVFVRDMVTGVTMLASVNAAGTQSGFVRDPFNSSWSANPLLSADGRKVVFDSLAPDLTAGDTNGIRDVFLRDLDAGTTLQVSLGAFFPTNLASFRRYGSFAPAMSSDGNRVAFMTTATNDTPRFGNPLGEVCVRDVAAGVTYWASSNAANLFAAPVNVGSTNPVLSANGRVVAFVATSSGSLNVLLVRHDLDSGQDSVITSNMPPRAIPAVSADGRYIAFEETATGGSALYLWDAQAQSKTLLSVSTTGTVRNSDSPAMTPDGRFVAFVSSSGGLVTNPVSGGSQVYVRDVVAGTTTLVSANAAGKGTTDHSYVVPAISTNGAWVALDSDMEDLVPGDLNRASDVFVRDVAGATTALVSRRVATLPSETGAAFSTFNGGALSADGRFLLFGMTDGYEMPRDTNHFLDLFVRDLALGTNIPVTLMPNGQATTNFTPRDWVISGNGRYVAYVSTPALPPWFFGQDIRLLRRDLQSGSDALVTASPGSVAASGYLGNRFPVAMSADGNQIAFLGAATPTQIYVRDMAAGTNRLATVNRLGTGGCNNTCNEPVISPDGRWLVFVSSATDLVSNTLAAGANLFARDLLNGTTEVVATLAGYPAVNYTPVFSANSRRVAFVYPAITNRIAVYDFVGKATQLATGPDDLWSVRNPSLSADGRYVAFEAIKGNSSRDIYRTDLDAAATTLVSVSRFGLGGGNRNSSVPRLSADGRYVVFFSDAWNLDARVTNQLAAVYLRDIWGGTTLVSRTPDGTKAGNAGSALPVLSADGRILSFQSFASDLTSDDFNGAGDIFALNLGTLDSDADGMDDAWEMAYFNNLSRDGAGDFDHDGTTDLQEFLAGTDPTNAGSVFQVLTLSRPSGGTTTALWSAVPGKTYRLQYKTSVDSAPWIDVAGDVLATGSTAFKTVTAAPAAQAQFFRVWLVQ